MQYVHSKWSIKLIQLIGHPDEIQWDTKRPYSELVTPHGTSEISKYAFATSPSKDDLVAKNETGYVDAYSVKKAQAFVEMTHGYGLEVHPWVLRDENKYLAWTYGQDAYSEVSVFVEQVKVDGFFTDFPQTAANYFKYRAKNAS